MHKKRGSLILAKSDRFDNKSKKKREKRGEQVRHCHTQPAAHSETHSQVNRSYSIKREKESKTSVMQKEEKETILKIGLVTTLLKFTSKINTPHEKG